MENKTIITISRQFGSGGREIGKKIADQLGIPFYDKELIEIAAKESGMDKELFEEDDARTSKGFRLLGALGYSLGGPLSTITELSLNDRLYLVQEEVIKGVACEGSRKSTSAVQIIMSTIRIANGVVQRIMISASIPLRSVLTALWKLLRCSHRKKHYKESCRKKNI